MRAKTSPVCSFLTLFSTVGALIYCSATGAFPVGATVGAKTIKREVGDHTWQEQQVLADGVTPHGTTRIFAKEGDVVYQLSEMIYSRGDQVQWTEFWPSGNMRARSYEPYVGSPVRYEIFDEDGVLVRTY